jgi:nitrogenase-stabilizing/protective protein
MSALQDQLAALSTAEDFFLALDVPFDPHYLHVKRLHILKHFNERLSALTLTGLDPAAERTAVAAALAAAYADAQSVAPQDAGLFKVFQKPVPSRVFVPLEAVTR